MARLRSLLPLCLIAVLFAAMGLRIVQATQTNLLGYRLLHHTPSPLLEWYQPHPAIFPTLATDHCLYLSVPARYPGENINPTGCPRQTLLQTWQARQAWQQGEHERACTIWQGLDTAVDPWVVVKINREQGNWHEVAAGLQCLEHWNPSVGQPQQAFYPGWAAETYLDLGNVYAERDEVEMALVAYDKAAQWTPTAWAAPAMRSAQLLEAQGQSEAAMQRLSDAVAALSITEKDTRYILFVELGEMAYRSGQMARAISAYEEARASVPNNPFPYHRLAALYQENGQVEQAISVVEDGLAGPLNLDGSGRMTFLILLSEMYEIIGDVPQAICSYQESIAVAQQIGTEQAQVIDLRNKVEALQEQVSTSPFCD